MDWLRTLRRRTTARTRGGARAAALAALAPEAPFSAIGDVHGRLDLLAPLLERLPPGPVVLVGDYIDRGPDSAGVLDLLHAQAAAGEVICLAGNHEAMLLDFLDDPLGRGTPWLMNGGLQTLWSLGLAPHAGESQAAMVDLAAALAERLGPLLPWLRALPLLWQSGNVAVAHAGTDPARPIDAQGRRALQWARPRPGQPPRPDGIWVIHGHTIVPEVEITPGRINCDTGAFDSGRLSAVHIQRGGLRILDSAGRDDEVRGP